MRVPVAAALAGVLARLLVAGDAWFIFSMSLAAKVTTPELTAVTSATTGVVKLNHMRSPGVSPTPESSTAWGEARPGGKVHVSGEGGVKVTVVVFVAVAV